MKRSQCSNQFKEVRSKDSVVISRLNHLILAAILSFWNSVMIRKINLALFLLSTMNVKITFETENYEANLRSFSIYICPFHMHKFNLPAAILSLITSFQHSIRL